MSSKLGFKKHFRVEICKDELLVFLLSEIENFVLKGPVYTALAPLLDGTKNTDQIVDAIMEVREPAEIYYAIEIMRKKGYISEQKESLPGKEIAYWHQLGFSDDKVKEELNNTTVCLTPSSFDLSSLISAVKSLGMNVITTKGPEEKIDISGKIIYLSVTDDYLNKELFKTNTMSLKNNMTWMIMKPVGLIIWIGPIFIPSATGCWECLAGRLRSKRDIELFIQTKKKTDGPVITSTASLPTTMETAWQTAAQQIALWAIKGKTAPLAGKIISFNTAMFKSEEHMLVKRELCPVCGNKKASDFSSKINLKSQKKNFILGSGHRILSAEETFKKYSHHISPITGILDSLIKGYEEENNTVHVYFGGHNFAVQHHNISMLERHIRSLSAGKGTTDIQAKTGALCEAIERYSGLFQGYEERIKATYKEVKDKAIFPNDYMNFSENQYKNRDFINKNAHHFQIVPLPLEEEVPLDWSPVWSLTRKEFRYILSSYCYYGYPYKEDYFFTWPNSNGCASGNTLEEAILQGFFEVVERDSVALWWYNMLERPSVNIESFNIPYIKKLKEFYEENQREIWALDITSDTGIPTFAAISRSIKEGPEEIVFAFGSHFDPSVALIRAVTEMNQFMPHMFLSSPDEYTFKDPFVTSWWKNARLENNTYLAPGKMKEKTFSDYENTASDDLLADIKRGQKIIENLGMEFLVLDQTRPDIGLNVAKVIIPGMRHMWQRLGPGRLYDIPVKMGWLKEQKKESELNPVAVFV